MTGRRVAIVGAGMTRFVRRAQETGKELAFQDPELSRRMALPRLQAAPAPAPLAIEPDAPSIGAAP